MCILLEKIISSRTILGCRQPGVTSNEGGIRGVAALDGGSTTSILEYLCSAKHLNPRQARWAMFFTRFQFTVTYRPGSRNTKADVPSRQVEEVERTETEENIISNKLLVAPVQWDVMTEITQLNEQTAKYPPVCYSHCPCPWSHIAIDFVTDLPVSRGHTTILTDIDRFSKVCRLILLPKLPTGFETAEILCKYLFRFYGLPEDIVLDREPQFTSWVWAAFFKHLNINVSLTSGYHPKSNGQTERMNQVLTRFLCTYCQQNQTDWSRYLMWAEYAQNSLQKAATGLTPFKCVLGYQPPLFPWSGEPSNLPSVKEWLQQSEETWNLAHHHLQHAVSTLWVNGSGYLQEIFASDFHAESSVLGL